MAFIWNTIPDPPAREMPQAVPPGEITYEQKEVANLVNAGGTLSYNTPNVGFDILYQLPSANITMATFTNAFFDNMTINTANISTATINLANVQTANILNTTILYGYVGSDPTSNLGIATKHYVDAAMANVPTGGSDLQNIIDAKGDLLVGIAANTATRLPVGMNGQILIADSTANTGLRWISSGGGLGSFHNLWIQTHYDLSVKRHQLILRHADQIIMNSGIRTVGWLNMLADITLTGVVGGLDTGVEAPSHWYEVYAIRDGGSGNVGLLLHQASEIIEDQSLTTTTDGSVNLRTVGGALTKIAQSFIPGNTGPLTSVELELSRVGSPTGLYWITIEADSGDFPSGNALATSRVMDVSRLPTDKARVRLIFDTNTSVTQGTTYHVVYQSDYALSDTNYTNIWGVNGGYANGKSSQFNSTSNTWFNVVPSPTDLWFKIFIQTIPATPLVYPSGYDESCLISYVYNNSAGHFKPYVQKNRQISMSIASDWLAFTAITGRVEAVNLVPYIPPIPCAVQFYVVTAHDSPNIATPIGGIACTDLPIGNGPCAGSCTANAKGLTVTSPGRSIAQFNYLIVENQVILARMANADTKLYSTLVKF